MFDNWLIKKKRVGYDPTRFPLVFLLNLPEQLQDTLLRLVGKGQ